MTTVRAHMVSRAPSFVAAGVLTAPAFASIVAERVAQIDEHGFTPEHDLGHRPEVLAAAAASYLDTACDQLEGRHQLPSEHPETWPWEREAWKPGDARANLVKAAAIIWALVDRLDGPTPIPVGEGAEPC